VTVSMSSIKIGSRLGVGFGILLVLICLTGAFAVFHVSRIDAKTVEIAENWLSSVQTLADIRGFTHASRRATLSSVLMVD
jgi:Four helix bundle sensory module for signal transduction